MKGLIYKDLMQLKTQKTGLLFVLFLSIVFSFTFLKEGAVVSFCLFVMLINVTSTITMDEYNNFLGYLLSLPVSRHDYVKSKYVFAILLFGSTWFLGSLLSLLTDYILTKQLHIEIMSSTVMMPLMVMVIFAISLPFLLKFGGEKGRLIMSGVIGLVFGVSVYFMQFGEVLFQTISNASLTSILALTIVIVAVITLVSYGASIKVMAKKDL